ncbi:MAG: SRPBCC family protein [Renibacterium sp.]|nr:SRPBCC family protein [Renibacterium sp.]
MITVADHTAYSKAPAHAFYARWIDHESWPEWDTGSEWVRLDGPVAEGSKGKLKPKGGPASAFTIGTLVPDREYTDICRFPGATMHFQHLAEATPTGTELTVKVSFEGPLAWLWANTVGKGIAKDAKPALDRLIEILEAGRSSESPNSERLRS